MRRSEKNIMALREVALNNEILWLYFIAVYLEGELLEGDLKRFLDLIRKGNQKCSIRNPNQIS